MCHSRCRLISLIAWLNEYLSCLGFKGFVLVILIQIDLFIVFFSVSSTLKLNHFLLQLLGDCGVVWFNEDTSHHRSISCSDSRSTLIKFHFLDFHDFLDSLFKNFFVYTSRCTQEPCDVQVQEVFVCCPATPWTTPWWIQTTWVRNKMLLIWETQWEKQGRYSNRMHSNRSEGKNCCQVCRLCLDFVVLHSETFAGRTVWRWRWKFIPANQIVEVTHVILIKKTESYENQKIQPTCKKSCLFTPPSLKFFLESYYFRLTTRGRG